MGAALTRNSQQSMTCILCVAPDRAQLGTWALLPDRALQGSGAVLGPNAAGPTGWHCQHPASPSCF